MSEETERPRWWRRLKVLFFGTAGMAAVVGLSFAALSFWPTGWEKFERENAGAAARVEELAKPGETAAGGAASGQALGNGVATDARTTNSVQLPAQKPRAHKAFRATCEELSRMGGDYLLAMTPRLDWGMQLRAGPLRDPNDPAERAETINAQLAQFMHSMINSNRDNNQFCQREIGLLSKTERERVRQELSARCDRIEEFLIASVWESSSYQDFPESSFLMGPFDYYALLATLRACKRGEFEKAIQLVDRSLEAQGNLYFNLYPAGEDFWSSAKGMLVILGNHEEFPVAGLERARQTLEHMRLSDSEIEQLNMARLLRARSRIATALNNKGLSLKGNTWAFVFGGKPARAIGKALVPAAQRQVERAIEASARGNFAELESAISGAGQVGWAMNIGELDRFVWAHISGSFQHWSDDIPAPLRELYWAMRDRSVKEGYNRPLDEALFVVGAALYKRVHGAYPTSEKDLIPQYLLPVATRGGDVTWRIVMLPSGEFLKIAGYDESVTILNDLPLPHLRKPPFSSSSDPRLVTIPPPPDPFFNAVYRYRQAHGRSYPVTIEDLRPYAADNAEFESFRTRIGTTPPWPVFARAELDWSNEVRLSQIRERYELAGSAPRASVRMEELKAEMAAPPDYLEVTLSLPWPLRIPEDYMEVLMENSAEKER